MKTIYKIREYGSFVSDRQIDGYVTLPKRTFEQLESFILNNESSDTDALELMSLSARRGIGKIITAKNYVGLITMSDGSVIEILPKIYSAIDDEDGKKSKKLLIEMLKTLKDSPYKTLQVSNMNVDKLNIFEIFIRMFVDEVFYIVKRGLKCNYELIEENLNFFRGKIEFAQHIKYNHVHKERSYVEYDTFTVNRPENRILKATLRYMYRVSTSSKNRNDIKTLLNIFNEVEESVDYKNDFAKYVPDRNMKDYTTALKWSRVFLMGKSFTSFSGSEVTQALLFPMETLFESYIAALLKKKLDNREFSVSIQDRSYHLFDEPRKKFLMKPDIVVRRKMDDSIFIIDTKWKILSENKSNYGISQADMYQMYAYHKKYDAQCVMLVYPQTETMLYGNEIEYKSKDEATVKIKLVDLFDIQNGLTDIMGDILTCRID